MIARALRVDPVGTGRVLTEAESEAIEAQVKQAAEWRYADLLETEREDDAFFARWLAERNGGASDE